MSTYPNESEMARRIGENEARFRDANEKIEDAALRLQPDMKTLPFVCECGRPDCFAPLRLTVAEYELARQSATFFVCLPGHQLIGKDLGREVEIRDRFVIVEKLGSAGAVAEARDPRQQEAEETG